METDQILDLFNIGETVAAPKPGSEEESIDATTGEVRQKGTKGVLDDIGELGSSQWVLAGHVVA